MKKKTVIVLACHRSGTKMVGECMNAGGVLFGFKRLYGDDSYWSAPKLAEWVRDKGDVIGFDKHNNPLMFTEFGSGGVYKTLRDFSYFKENEYIIDLIEQSGDHRITWIDDFILAFCKGLNWDRAEHLNIHLEKEGHLRLSLSNLGKSIIEDYNSKTDYWGIKDPRIVSTFSFWEKILGQFDNEIKLVFLYRNPIAVARGSQHDITGVGEKHPDWPIERGLRMWKEHNSVMLDLMEKPYEKIVLKYEAFLEGDDEVERLDRFLGLGGKFVNPFDPNRQHQKSDEVPEDCREIWERLEEAREKSMREETVAERSVANEPAPADSRTC